MKKLFQLFVLFGIQTSLAQGFTIQPNSVSSNALNTTANRVGINIANPNYELHVNRAGNVNSFAQFTNGVSGNTANDGLLIGLNDTGKSIMKLQSDTSPMVFNVGNIDKLVLEPIHDQVLFNATQLKISNPNFYVDQKLCSKNGARLSLYADYDNDSDGLPSYNNGLEFKVEGLSESGSMNGLSLRSLVSISTSTFNDRLLIKNEGKIYFGGRTNLAFTFNTQTERMGIAMGLNEPQRTLDVNGDARIGVNGTTVTAINNGTAWIDLPSLAANNSYYTEVNVANVDAGKNTVMVSPSIALPNGFMITYSKVTVNNTVRIGFHNASSNIIDLIGMDFYITVITFP